MKKVKMIGERFGDLTVLSVADISYLASRSKRYNCRCSCGRIVQVRGDNLRSGHSTKCKVCYLTRFKTGGDEVVDRE